MSQIRAEDSVYAEGFQGKAGLEQILQLGRESDRYFLGYIDMLTYVA
jgi:hypothetical protein